MVVVPKSYWVVDAMGGTVEAPEVFPARVKRRRRWRAVRMGKRARLAVARARMLGGYAERGVCRRCGTAIGEDGRCPACFEY